MERIVELLDAQQQGEAVALLRAARCHMFFILRVQYLMGMSVSECMFLFVFVEEFGRTACLDPLNGQLAMSAICLERHLCQEC